MAALICIGIVMFLNSVFITKVKGTLQELRSDTYFNELTSGKTSLLYFSTSDFPSSTMFLDELQKSVAVLQDYGIHVAKVNCIAEALPKYCAGENAYLFRGNKLLREFPTDALFDVNSIVANVLFVLLYNEVKYITSSSELQNIENAIKGKRDGVFIYIQAIGIPDHRSVMETAFVYGSKYQFISTTETKILENISTEESGSDASRLFFLHCKTITNHSQKCPRTLLEQSMTTVNIHRFLKIMDAPLVTEIYGDPEKATSVHLQVGLPMVIFLSQQETYDLDRSTAEHVAWQLLGKAGISILLRDKSHPSVPSNCNIAVKRPEKDTAVKYMMMEETREIQSIIGNPVMEQYNQSEKKSYFTHQAIETQDDEVAEAVYRDRKRTLPLHLVSSLTDETLKKVLISADVSVVLYYTSWEAVSMTLLQSCVNMAEEYKDVLGMTLTRVNCADWPKICNGENITMIPSVKLYQKGKEPLLYSGMLGTEELLHFIMLAKIDCPLELLSIEEAENYLSGRVNEFLLPYNNLLVLGIFTNNEKEGVNAYIDAGKSLRGFASLAIYYEGGDMNLSKNYGISSPALLFSRPNNNQIYGITLQNTASADIIHHIRLELLGNFPEITVETFPTLFKQKKPLLVLFCESNPTHNDGKHILNLVRGRYLEHCLACWLNLKNTPVGNIILKQYIGFVPHLPLLVLIDLDILGQVFMFPSDQSLTEVNILFWLEMIKAGAEVPGYTLSNEDWKPPLPDYDFLGVMDAESPNYAAQKIRINMKSSRIKKTEDFTEGSEPEETEAKQHLPGSSLRGTVPRFIEMGKKLKSHTEL